MLKNFELPTLSEYAKQNFIPIVKDDTKKVLLDIIKNNNPKSILEIGTAIGYSGVEMLKNCHAKLTTVEIDIDRYKIAQQVFEYHKLSDRVIIHNQDALTLLKNLVDSNQKFDFIFLDGPKGQYLKYMHYIEKLLSDNSIIFADNINFLNMVNDDSVVEPPRKVRTIVVNLRKFKNYLINNSNLHTEFISVGEGVAIIKKTNKN